MEGRTARRTAEAFFAACEPPSSARPVRPGSIDAHAVRRALSPCLQWRSKPAACLLTRYPDADAKACRRPPSVGDLLYPCLSTPTLDPSVRHANHVHPTVDPLRPAGCFLPALHARRDELRRDGRRGGPLRHLRHL